MNVETEKQTYCLGPIVARIAIPEIFIGAPGPIAYATFIPLLLLEIAARSDLSLNGVSFAHINGLGTLNRGVLIVDTEAVGPALQRLETVLKKSHLWEFTSVYFFDGRENLFRPHHDGLCCDPHFRFGHAELEADVASFSKAVTDSEALLAMALKHLEQKQTPPTSCPKDSPTP